MTDQKKPRGFAAIPAERQQEIAAMGAKAVRAAGKAHRWDSEAAKAARALSSSPAITSENAKERGSAGGKARAAKLAKEREVQS